MSSKRVSTASVASTGSKRWSMPALQPLPDLKLTQPSTSRTKPASSSIVKPRQAKGSISGTAFDHADLATATSAHDRRAASNERRMSRRMSRLSKLSNVSEGHRSGAPPRSMSSSMPQVAEGEPVRRVSVVEGLAADSERRRSKRLSILSTTTSINRFSMLSRANIDWRQKPEQLIAPDLWADNIRKPSNWPLFKMVTNTLMACAAAFAYTMSLSIFSAATPPSVLHMGNSAIVSIIPYSTFALGMALGPAFATPYELAYGRKAVFLATLPFFALFMIGAGVSRNIAELAICRGMAAFFAGPGLFLTYAMVAEIWVPHHETLGIAGFVASIVLGFAAGPIVGGVAVYYQSWPWTQWVGLILVVILLFCAIGMSETQEHAIKRRVKPEKKFDSDGVERKPSIKPKEPSRLKHRGNFMFSKSIRMLAAAPTLSIATLYIGYTLAILISLPIMVMPIFGTTYQFNIEQQGLVFVGTAGGVIIAFAILFLFDTYIHQPRLQAWQDECDPMDERAGVKTTAPAKRAPNFSWRKGIALSTNNLGLRTSISTIDTERSNSDASRVTRRSFRGPSNRTSVDLGRRARKSRLQAFSERNINIAIAVTRYLNAQPANADKKIIVERVMLLLKETDSFTVITASLAEMKLHFENALLAKVITDALKKEKSNSEIGLSRSRSLHQNAAQATLMGETDNGRSISVISKGVSIKSAIREKPVGVKLTPPPPEWRWLPALLGSLLFPAGLAIFAWTARASIHWIAPCLGVGLVGVGACLIAFSAICYTMELHEDMSDAAGARTGATVLGFLLAAIIPLIVHPLFDALGMRIGTTIFAGIALVLGILPWYIAFRGGKLRSEDGIVEITDGKVEPLMQEKLGLKVAHTLKV